MTMANIAHIFQLFGFEQDSQLHNSAKGVIWKQTNKKQTKNGTSFA